MGVNDEPVAGMPAETVPAAPETPVAAEIPFAPSKVSIDRTVRLPSMTFCLTRHARSGRTFCGRAGV